MSRWIVKCRTRFVEMSSQRAIDWRIVNGKQNQLVSPLPGECVLADASEIVKFHINFGITARVLAAHVDDGSGHCAGCAWQNVPRPVWPCDHA